MNTKMILIVFWIFFGISESYGYTEILTNTSAYSGTMGAGKSVGGQRTGISQNPATLTPHSWGFSAHTYKPFLIESIRINELSLFHDSKHIGKALHLFSISIDKLYQDHTLEFQISYRLPYSIYIGGSVVLSYLQIKSLETQTILNSHFGMIYAPWNWIKMGVYTLNVVAPSKIREQFNHPIFLGFSLHSPKKRISLYFDFYKDPVLREWRSTFGQTFSIFSFIQIALGVDSKPLQFSLQISISFKNFKLGQTHTLHQELGYSQHYHLWGQFNSSQIKSKNLSTK